MTIPLIKPHTCSTCAFKEREGNQFRCHRNPPSVSPVVAGSPGGSGFHLAGEVALWPIVKPEHWCGEYRAFAQHGLTIEGESLRTQ